MIESLSILGFFSFELAESAMLILSTRVTIYQPQFFPRLHYFARILNSAVYGIADNVQFVRKHAYHGDKKSAGPSYQAHTPIKTRNGVLLVDYSTESGFKSIAETKIVYTARSDKMLPLRLIEEHYRKAPQFKSLQEPFRAFFGKEYTTVGSLNVASTLWSLGMLFESERAKAGEADLAEVHAKLAESPFQLRQIAHLSAINVPTSDKEGGRDANDWLIDCCAHFNGDEYHFGGTGAQSYMDFAKFEKAGIKLVEQEWKCPEYRQEHGAFISNLSIIDLLMNVPAPEAREILHRSLADRG